MTKEEKQLVIDYKETFSSERGKRVLAHLRKILEFDFTVVSRGHDGHIDIYEMMRNEGKRAVIIHILKKMETNPDEPKQETAIHNETLNM